MLTALILAFMLLILKCLMQTLSQVVFHRLDDESYIFERRPQLLHRLQVRHFSSTRFSVFSPSFTVCS